MWNSRVSPKYPAPRQRLLQFFDRFFRRLRANQAELPELFEPRQTQHSRVGDLRPRQAELLEPGQRLDVYEPGIGDLRRSSAESARASGGGGASFVLQHDLAISVGIQQQISPHKNYRIHVRKWPDSASGKR
jgi:hypothetical protein